MRLDVHEAKRRRGFLLVNCQSRFLDHLDTRLTLPLMPLASDLPPISRLHPVFEIDDRAHVLLTHQAAAVPARELGRIVGSLADQMDEVSAAIGLLLNGF